MTPAPIKQGDTVEHAGVKALVAQVVSIRPGEILMFVENETGRWPTPIRYWRTVECPK